jgi:hypothetical protein
MAAISGEGGNTNSEGGTGIAMACFRMPHLSLLAKSQAGFQSWDVWVANTPTGRWPWSMFSTDQKMFY